MIKIDIVGIVSRNCKSYKIATYSKEIELGAILFFKNNKYKVDFIDKKYGLSAFKLLANGISKSKYIHINTEITILTEMSKKNKRQNLIKDFQ